MDIVLTRPLALAAMAGLCFALSTFLMKSLADGPSLGVGGLLALCLAASVCFEIMALRYAPLGIVYVSVIAVQSLAVLAIASLYADGLDAQKLAGAGLMLVGASVIAG